MGLLLILAASSVVPATAHEEKHAPDSVVPLAPGYQPLGFRAPTPGSYILPPLGTADDGAVLLSDGSSATLHELFGSKLVLLSFIYASCSDVNGCPLATAVLHRVQSTLRARPEVARELAVLSLSFDPRRDTPEVMRRYGASFADPAVSWEFLTASSEETLRPILDAYGQSVSVEIGPDGQPLGTLSHVLRVFLIDRSRNIRNVYSVSFLHADTLMSDIETLLLEEKTAGNPRDSPTPSHQSPAVVGSGDPRGGYESTRFQTRSNALAARRGAPTDLVATTSDRVLGLPAVSVPANNPVTRAKVALGRSLFFDRRLSSNGTLSCAMCHVPEQGFANNEMATAVGIEGRSVRRNAPTVLNAALMSSLFHDGRETSLEEQIWSPLLAQNEMGNASRAQVVERIRNLDDYASRFDLAFPKLGLSEGTVGMAVASYERVLLAGDSPFDLSLYAGQTGALDESAARGFALFTGRAGCAQCHTVGANDALFSDNDFHNTGAGASQVETGGIRVQIAPGRFVTVDRALVQSVSEPRREDHGREEVTGNASDRGRFRTPSLRNVALTAPYMHDGSIADLAAVVSFYDAGGRPNAHLDPLVRRLNLSPQDRADLVSFLRSLTSRSVDGLVADAFAAPVGERD